MFENQPKSRIQHCERSELRLHFEWTKIHQKWQKWSNLTNFWLTEATFQLVLPDKPLLIGQKLIENAKIEKFRCDILGDFQTLCERQSYDNGEKRSQCCYYLQKKSQNPQKSQEKEAWRQLFSRFISCLPAIFSNSPKGENHVRVILCPNIELGTCLLRTSRFFLLEGYLHWWWFPKGPACLFF